MIKIHVENIQKVFIFLIKTRIKIEIQKVYQEILYIVNKILIIIIIMKRIII